ncbi:hypothetical protein BC629DRAFT_1725001 [Irpex lacteus]|nr:hypothetical protein BC629DRAFT_1725001 [Irpex lacteus]
MASPEFAYVLTPALVLTALMNVASIAGRYPRPLMPAICSAQSPQETPRNMICVPVTVRRFGVKNLGISAYLGTSDADFMLVMTVQWQFTMTDCIRIVSSRWICSPRQILQAYRLQSNVVQVLQSEYHRSHINNMFLKEAHLSPSCRGQSSSSVNFTSLTLSSPGQAVKPARVESPFTLPQPGESDVIRSFDRAITSSSRINLTKMGPEQRVYQAVLEPPLEKPVLSCLASFLSRSYSLRLLTGRCSLPRRPQPPPTDARSGWTWKYLDPEMQLPRLASTSIETMKQRVTCVIKTWPAGDRRR